jgi:hypothetical protein
MATGDKSSKPVRHGLDNPHPFSQFKTGLVGDGKYGGHGNRLAVDVSGCNTGITMEVGV